MTTYMFPGQGSQSVGMGAELFDKFNEQTGEADSILGYSIKELCLKDSQNKLSDTQFTQPALYVVEALAWLAKMQSTSVKPDYCIGHSLGEYSALFSAGVFDFKTGLELVKKRGELMAQATGGGMLAVINLPAERITQLLQNNNLRSIDFANFNSPKQIVLSGPAEDIKRANQVLSAEAMMCVPLRVSGAFHSRYMEKAASEFEQFLEGYDFQAPQIEVIANVTATPYTQDTVKNNLVKQIMSPVCWTETIRFLKQKGEKEFLEVGPGTVLARLMAQN